MDLLVQLIKLNPKCMAKKSLMFPAVPSDTVSLRHRQELDSKRSVRETRSKSYLESFTERKMRHLLRMKTILFTVFAKQTKFELTRRFFKIKTKFNSNYNN